MKYVVGWRMGEERSIREVEVGSGANVAEPRIPLSVTNIFKADRVVKDWKKIWTPSEIGFVDGRN